MDAWADAQILSSWASIIYAELLAFVAEMGFQSRHYKHLLKSKGSEYYDNIWVRVKHQSFSLKLKIHSKAKKVFLLLSFICKRLRELQNIQDHKNSCISSVNLLFCSPQLRNTKPDRCSRRRYIAAEHRKVYSTLS